MGVSDQQVFVLHGSAFQAIFHNNNLRRSCMGTVQIFLQSSAPREVAGVKPVGRNRVVFQLLLHLKTHFNSSWTHLALLILVLKAQFLLSPITMMDRLILRSGWIGLLSLRIGKIYSLNPRCRVTHLLRAASNHVPLLKESDGEAFSYPNCSILNLFGLKKK